MHLSSVRFGFFSRMESVVSDKTEARNDKKTRYIIDLVENSETVLNHKSIHKQWLKSQPQRQYETKLGEG